MAVRVLLVACLLAHALYAALEPVTGGDTWWSMVAGRWIVEHGSVPTVDTLSYTFAGKPWFNQEWLAQVIFYELYLLGGAYLALLKIVLVVAVFLLAAWIAARRSGSPVLAVATTCAAAFLCRPMLDIRAQLFTFLFSLVVLAAIHAYRRGAPPAVLALLPVSVALWVNLHYGFIFGVGMCLLYAGGETLKSLSGLPDAPLPRARLAPLWVAAGLALLASLANPQGLHSLTFPFTIVGEQDAWREEIIEWMPPVLFGSDSFSPLLFGPWLALQIAVLVAALLLMPRKIDVTDTLLVATTAAMALTSRRFIPLFALLSVPFLARNLALIGAELPALVSVRRRTASVALLAVLALGHVAWRAVPAARRDLAPGLFDGLTRSFFFPKGAVEFLHVNPLPARLFHIYTWAGYLLYFAPERQVFIDGRAHAVYPIDFWHEFFRVEIGDPGWDAVLDKYEVNVVLCASGFAGGGHKILLDQLTRSADWVRVYDDRHSAVFAHTERGRDWVEAFRAFRLRYPDVLGAQLFLYDSHLRAGDLEGGRQQLAHVLAEFPATRADWQQAVEKQRQVARVTGTAGLWFQVAYPLEVLGDRAGAVEAYTQALAAGIAEPFAGYSRTALTRLGAPQE
jgi:hypothetical protein